MFCKHLNGKCRTPAGFWSLICISTIMAFALIGNPASIYAAEVTPDQLEFRRQAVRRMIFDRSQDIWLAGLWPAKVVGLDVMHPAVGEQLNNPRISIEEGNMPEHKSEGRSLRNLIEGEPDSGPDFCVSEWGASRGPTMMVRTADYKYICAHSSKKLSIDALYNLKDDPDELNNLIGTNPDKAKYKEQVTQMMACLISWLEKIESPRLTGVKKRLDQQMIK